MMTGRIHSYLRRGARPLKPLMRRVRAAWWSRTHRDFLVVFNWHQVTPVFDPCIHHRYTWTQLDTFIANIDHVAAEFQVLPIHEAIRRINNGSLHGRCAALTFDDGDASINRYVVPILRQRNLPATFFINSAYIDRPCTYWFPILAYSCWLAQVRSLAFLPDALAERAMQLRQTSDPYHYNEVRSRVEEYASSVPNLRSRLVSTEWLSTLDGDQFAIGAHGHEHQRYSMMTPDWQRNDLRQNMRLLSEFRAYRAIFAIPFGRPWDWTEEVIRIARDEGLEVVVANGGINFDPKNFYERISTDGASIERCLTSAIA